MDFTTDEVEKLADAYDKGGDSHRESLRRVAECVAEPLHKTMVHLGELLLETVEDDGHIRQCGNGGEDQDDCSPRCLEVRRILWDAGFMKE